MEKLSLQRQLALLESRSLESIKTKFSKGRDHFLYPKDNMLASKFLGLLCETKRLSAMSAQDFGFMVESIYPDGIREVGWLSKYCDLLTRTLDSAKQKEISNHRAQLYYDHLQNVLIKEFKTKIGNQKQTPIPEDIWKDLTDIYKIATALFAYLSGGDFSLDLTEAQMDALENTLRTNDYVLRKIGPIRGFDGYSHDDRQYAVMISWILIEILKSEDGIGEE